jgi:ATP-dependent Clp protease ATP-binding subunit ClpC
MFNHLSREDIDKIIDIELKGLFDRIEALGYKIKLSAQARDFMADRGFDIQYGARPLKRAIQKYLEDPLAEVIIKTSVSEGATINVGYSKEKEELTFRVSGKKETEETNSEESSGK